MKPNRQRPPALESAVFTASERTALAETLFGIDHGAARSFGQVDDLKNPANITQLRLTSRFAAMSYGSKQMIVSW